MLTSPQSPSELETFDLSMLCRQMTSVRVSKDASTASRFPFARPTWASSLRSTVRLQPKHRPLLLQGRTHPQRCHDQWPISALLIRPYPQRAETDAQGKTTALQKCTPSTNTSLATRATTLTRRTRPTRVSLTVSRTPSVVAKLLLPVEPRASCRRKCEVMTTVSFHPNP